MEKKEDRIEELMKVADLTHKYGSIGRHLPKITATTRTRVGNIVFRESESLSEKTMSASYGIPLSWQEKLSDDILNSHYGLPPNK